MARGPVRGSTTGRPIMVLLDVLGKRWTLRVLWELKDEALTFRELRARCEDVSPTVLNQRLKELRALGLLTHDDNGYGYTPLGRELGALLDDLNRYAGRWDRAVNR